MMTGEGSRLSRSEVKCGLYNSRMKSRLTIITAKHIYFIGFGFPNAITLPFG